MVQPTAGPSSNPIFPSAGFRQTTSGTPGSTTGGTAPSGGRGGGGGGGAPLPNLGGAIPPQNPNPPPNSNRSLKGDPPEIFRGDRTKSECFIQQFSTFYMVNQDNEVMSNPYKRIAIACTYLKGDKVEEWTADQLMLLEEKVTVQHRSPNDENLWQEFDQNFRRAWTDTSQAQRADMDIRRLSMKDMGLDDYTSKFEHLVRKAGWTRDDQNTVTEFVQGLQRWLALKLIGRAPPLDKHQLTPWIEAAREEVTLNEERNAMVRAFSKKNEIVQDSCGKNWKPTPQKKPQKDPDAMEVDVATTSVPKDKRLTKEQ